MWNKIKRIVKVKKPEGKTPALGLLLFAIGITLIVLASTVFFSYAPFAFGMFFFILGGVVTKRAITIQLTERAFNEQLLVENENIRPAHNEAEEKKSPTVSIRRNQILNDSPINIVSAERKNITALEEKIHFSASQPFLDDRLNIIKLLSVKIGVKASVGVWWAYWLMPSDDDAAKKEACIIAKIINKLTEAKAVTIENLDIVIDLLKNNPGNISYLNNALENLTELNHYTVNTIMQHLNSFIVILSIAEKKKINLNLDILIRCAGPGLLSKIIEECKKLGDNFNQAKIDEIAKLIEASYINTAKILLLLPVAATDPAVRHIGYDDVLTTTNNANDIIITMAPIQHQTNETNRSRLLSSNIEAEKNDLNWNAEEQQEVENKSRQQSGRCLIM